MSDDDLVRLQAKLIEMRAGLVEQLAVNLDGGFLALLGTVGLALAAVDDMLAAPDQGDPGRQ